MKKEKPQNGEMSETWQGKDPEYTIIHLILLLVLLSQLVCLGMLLSSVRELEIVRVRNNIK